MDFLKTLLPWIGAAATGGVPSLLTMAAGAVADALGVDVEPSKEGIEDAVRNATPEQILALKQADNDFKLKAQAMGFEHEEEIARLKLDETKAFVADTSDARHTFGQNERVFWLGAVVLLTFAVLAGFSLYGSYLILTKGVQGLDVGTVAAVATFIGSVIGYCAANAQQVIGYFFGSSQGSKDKTDVMAQAFVGVGSVSGGTK